MVRKRGEPAVPARRGITRRDFLKIGGTGLAGAALLGTAGCGVFQQQGGGQADGSRTVSVNLEDTIRDLDSTTTTDEVSSNILVNVIEGLYRLDENARPVPAQAKGVQISDDGLTYTFTLRDGIEWSNGDPVTSRDFRYAWLKALDPETAGQYAYIIAQFVRGAAEYNEGKGAAEDVAIEAPDDRTLEVRLVSPSPFWLGLTSFYTYYPQRQEFVEERGERYAQNADSLIYNGPYTLTEFDPTAGVTLVKNEGYWDAGNVEVQSVEGRIVKELDTAVNLHESGELDITEIDSQYVDEYRGSPDFDQRTTFTCFYLSFNEAVPLFQNVNIRKAFQMGFDRDTLAEKILNDGSIGAPGYVPEGIAGPGDQTFREAVGPTMPDFDPAEARRHFEQGIQEVGENPTIELLSYDDSVARDTATFLQSQFQENLGARIEVNVQPFDRKLELESNGEFQLSYQGWGADYNDPMTFLDLWESESPFNTGGYEDERYDELIDGAQSETDEERRMQLMIEAERLLISEDAGLAPMFFEGEVRLIEPFVENFVYQPYGGALDVKLWRVG
ncbi:MAG TPA: peptide ABC transporter substrate-binding protein [Rubrobacteraceae bacterium]|nr:peptide ABC transporter substrate-binding protein [Rubrobacteraceae bacterium]